MSVSIDFTPLKNLERQLEDLGRVPQKCVTGAARKGAQVVRKEAKRLAPKRTGELRRGLILYGEKVRGKSKGQKVYQIVLDRRKNNVFQRVSASGKVNGYYPSSQEYGFKLKNGERKAGQYYLKTAAENKQSESTKVMLQKFIEEVDKAWQKR